MKKYFSLLFIPVLGLASCTPNSPKGNGGNNYGGSDGSISQNDSSSELQSTGEWASDLQQAMTSVLGEVIPFIQLEQSSLEWEAYNSETEQLENPDCIQIYDASETDLLTDKYDRVLTAAGYTFDEEWAEIYLYLMGINYYPYYKWISGDTYLYVEYYYQEYEPAGVDDEGESYEATEAGNVITAYLYTYEDEGGDDDSELTGDPDEVIASGTDVYNDAGTDWSDELKAYMNLYQEALLPFVKLDSEYCAYDIYGDGTVNVYDQGPDIQDVLTDSYDDVLLQNDYVLLDSGLDDWGDMLYIYGKDVDEESQLIVQFQYYITEDKSGNELGVNDIYFYLYTEEPAPDGSLINFGDDSTYVEDHDDEQGRIRVGQYTITVDVGESVTPVGNNQWPDNNDRFRFYKDQILIITWTGEAPSEIVFTCSSSSYNLNKASINGGSLSHSGGVSTITVTGDSVSLILGQQARVSTIEFK